MLDKDSNEVITDGENNVASSSDERKRRKQAQEQERQQIRDRIRETNADSNAEYYPADPTPTIDDDSPKMVAAYTRVSTTSTEQVSSIENQTKFYTEKIENTPNWTLQGIYSDEGKSGTSMKRRAEFKKMLDAAAEGKIDLILCASVSRFARNISDCIDQVHLLKSQNPQHPVGVYFETEHIYTLDDKSSQAFDMHALLADWESSMKSSRMLLSYDQRIVMGQYPVADLLGYRHTKDGRLIIQEDEAITVRYIFLARMVGESFDSIAETLTQKERPTLTGRTEWTGNMAREITKNERRWGDLEARKTTVTDYKLGKTAKNTYEVDGVLHHIRNGANVENHHEGIVTRDIAHALVFASTSSNGIEGGLSDVVVIPNGALKGFVSTAPGWNGVDDSVFRDACQSVYTEEEISDMVSIVDIRTGENPAKVSSFGFHDYVVPHGSRLVTSGSPTIIISKNGIKVNSKTIERFGSEASVELLYHPLLQMFAIRSSHIDSPNGFCFTDESGKVRKNIRATGICSAIYEGMDWITSYSFQFRGVYRERNGFQIMLFYLDQPKIRPDKATKEKYATLEQGSHRHFIPYRNCDITEENKNSSVRKAVPFGLKMRRDEVLSDISSNDIAMNSIPVKNSKVGNIPTRAEILSELENLLNAM